MYKLFIFSLIFSFSKSYAADYWQQHVKYKIQVTLDDTHHRLEGTETLTYTNHSPETLDYIMFHLWANAFSTKKSPFNQQKIRTRNTTFHFADKDKMGGYEYIRFEEGGQELNFKYENVSHEIVKVFLNKPLQPGASVMIRINFKLKIPYTFSRLGHVKQSYQMTQWYPKPAVYDAYGWHTMPYLDLGEFYSEFGQYDVSITLPSNYVVGATGTLVTPSEQTFRQRIINESTGKIRQKLKVDSFAAAWSDSIPPSSPELKTIRFVADNVHDFAWFADKRYMIVEDRAKSPSGKTIPTYGYFYPSAAKLWRHSADYVKQSIEFFSEKIGEYPWPQASAVLGPLSAGGGMEYPMITIIAPMKSAKALDLVINHEVGHNWYYGILGSNERDHAWMDEGMNSYIDGIYAKKKYGNADFITLPDFISKDTDMPLNKLAYASKVSINADQPGDLPSNDYTMLNYQFCAYSNPQMYLDYLEQYVGTEEMDKVMHYYYEKWKFKHPYPQDVKQAYEEALGKNLDWLFYGLIGVGADPDKNLRMDYALTGWKNRKTNTVRAVNRGDVVAPVVLEGIKDGKVVRRVWIDGFEGSKNLTLGEGDFDMVSLDYKNTGPDINMENQSLRTRGWGKLRPLKISYYGIGLNHSKKLNNYILPVLGYNRQDGFMAGVLYHNITFPARPFRYYFMPMYGFKSKRLAGMADIYYNIYPRGHKLKRVRVGIFGRKFKGVSPDENHVPLDARVSPYLTFRIKSKMTSLKTHDIHLAFDRYYSKKVESGMTYNPTMNRMRISYELNDNNPIHSKRFHIDAFRVTQQKDYSNALALSLSGKWRYNKRLSLKYRFFEGYFLNQTQNAPKSKFYLTYNNAADNELLDDYFIGRQPQSGFYRRQIQINEGGFKDPITIGFTKSLTALNLELKIPKIPLTHIFVDQALVKNKNSTEKYKYYMSTGLSFNVMDVFALYFPLYNIGLEDYYNRQYPDKNKWTRRMSFVLKLKWNLDDLPEDLLFNN